MVMRMRMRLMEFADFIYLQYAPEVLINRTFSESAAFLVYTCRVAVDNDEYR
jgi:hypothetical protein